MSKKKLDRTEEINSLAKIDYSILEEPKNLNNLAYGYLFAFETMSDTLKNRAAKNFFNGILAGIWIGIAYIAASFAAYHTAPGVQKILMAVTFSLILPIIYFLGGGFLTAYMSLAWPNLKGANPHRDFFKTMGLIYSGNILGIGILVLFLELGGVFADQDLNTFISHDLGLKKLYEVGNQIWDNLRLNVAWNKGISGGMVVRTIVVVFFSAVICNMLVSLTPQAKFSSKGNFVGSIIMLCLVIFFFVIAGYQHTVANWFMLWTQLFVSIFQNKITTDGENSMLLSGAIPFIFLALNILPSLVGNYFGAMISGFLMYQINKPLSKLMIQRRRLTNLKN